MQKKHEYHVMFAWWRSNILNTIIFKAHHMKCVWNYIYFLCKFKNYSLINNVFWEQIKYSNGRCQWISKSIFTETHRPNRGWISHSNFEQQEDYGNHKIALSRSVWREHWAVFPLFSHRHHTIRFLFYIIMLLHSYFCCILYCLAAVVDIIIITI